MDLRTKCEVVNPCINLPELQPRKDKDNLVILFVGDFFRKGGANVVDAFEQLQTRHNNIRLQIIGNTQLDTHNQKLHSKYQKKITDNPNIIHTKVTRPKLFKDIYPNADIFVSPTYQETFGFAILEAMAFGLPVLSTAHFAIPEIIEENKSGLLIQTDQFDFIKQFKGYHVEYIPNNFHQYMNEQIYEKLEQLIVNETLRKSLTQQARLRCQEKFSPEIRANKMKVIYDDILN
nr:glycosyltransferase family 4 protein [Paraglaciecola arctica]